MQAGTYIVFCNIVPPAERPVSHFNNGVHTQFTLNT